MRCMRTLKDVQEHCFAMYENAMQILRECCFAMYENAI